MRIVIAGSSGLIGTALAAALRAQDHQITTLVRREPANPEEHRWDPPSAMVPSGALAGADAVINLCGAGIGDKRWTQERKQVLLDSRITPTEVLAAAVARESVPTLVNASAVGFYGDRGQEELTEDAASGSGFLAELCREWEAATAAASEAGARVVQVRT
ncbi:MAG: NAD-dependent epimerase/dehydratase family protein, partial [Sciscionella sp.]